MCSYKFAFINKITWIRRVKWEFPFQIEKQILSNRKWGRSELLCK
jgi:hypothetical protein